MQENCIDLVGRIADRGAEYVPAREWMRICFELLEMLKAHKKGIRRATVNTFGYIAKAIGPQARPWLFRLCAAHAWYAVAGALLRRPAPPVTCQALVLFDRQCCVRNIRVNA